MRLPSFTKLGSLLPVLGLLALSASAMIVSCADPDDGDRDWNAPPPGTTDHPDQAAIQTGATLDAMPGAGVGVFVEYATGGHWTVTTACDTNTSDLPCGFDVFVSGVDPKTALSNIQQQDAAGSDDVGVEQSSGTIHLFANTTTNLDGVTFDATPGATLEVEMYLDDQAQPRFVYWIGADKVLHTGAPTDPIDFAPTVM
jgi:hypothetical protein